MRSALPAILLIAFTVYCLVSVVQAADGELRNLPKWAWLLLVLLFPPVGGIAYLLAGRPLTPAGGDRGGFDAPAGGFGDARRANRPRRQSPRGPDDDEDFLRGL
ncbi:MAG: PLD nuclease N-terminal domain-containing protein [Janthinobacterium lividum]